MNQENMFRTPEQEAQELAREIRELKEILREISRKLGQIESRVKRAFPSALPTGSTASRRVRTPKLGDEPTLTPQAALKLYDELVQVAKEGNREEVQRRLENLYLPDLALLCRELGVSLGKKKPSRKTLLNGVLGRVNESVMLSTSSLRQRPDSQARDLSKPSTDTHGDTDANSIDASTS